MNIETINNDVKEAMKSGNKFELNVLRMLKSALQNEKISKNHDLDENEIIAVIKKQVKVRKDSLKEYQEYNREDLVEGLNKEIEIHKKNYEYSILIYIFHHNFSTLYSFSSKTLGTRSKSYQNIHIHLYILANGTYNPRMFHRFFLLLRFQYRMSLNVLYNV